MAERRRIDDAFLAAAMDAERLAILLACSDGPKRLDDLGLDSKVARSQVTRLATAGLIAQDGGVLRAVSDWRPFARCLEQIASQNPDTR